MGGSEKVDVAPEGADAKSRAEHPEATLFQMLSMASSFELFVLFVGFVGALGHGCSQPVVCLLFGNLVDGLGGGGAMPADVMASLPPAEMAAMKDAAVDAMMDDISGLCLKMLYFGLGTIACAWMQGACFKFFAEKQMMRLRIKYFEVMLFRDVSWYDKSQIAALPGDFADDMEHFGEGFGEKLGSSVMAGCSFVAGYICAFCLGWQIALVLLSILPLLACGGRLMARAMKAQKGEEQSWYSQASVVVEECLYSMRTVVAFGGEHRELEKFTKAVVMARRGGVRSGIETGLGVGYTRCVIFLGYSLAFYYGMTLRYNGTINPSTGLPWSPGTIMSIFFCIFIGSFSIGNVQPGVAAFKKGRKGAGRYFHILKTRTEIQCIGNDTRKKLTHIHRFDLEGVHFNYPARPDVTVLKGITLSFEQGKKYAVVGESGSGKSTVISLLERFYDPIQGAVLVNGEDIRNFAVSSLRKSIGYVGQEPVLFATSVRENIMQGNPDATDNDFKQACLDAQMEFIEKLPEQYDTFVGSGGSQFSGGQKQRIAIARALIKNANFLLLDEATSALDNKSEKMIQGTIEYIGQKMAGKLAIISIAHRLSTVRNCDTIYVLSRGLLVESGNHATLMEKQGMYYALAASQESAIQKDMARQVSNGSQGGNNEPSSLAKPEQEPGPRNTQIDQVKAMTSEVQKSKDRDKAIAKTYKVPMVRLLGFNKPEWPFFLPAFFGSIIDGCSMPCSALVLVQCMNSFFKPPDQMKADLEKLCLFFVGIAALMFVAVFLEMSCFAVLGEAMTQRIRVAILKALFTMEIGFHDDPENTPGMLSRALELYAFRVATLCTSLGNNAAAIAALVFGLCMAFAFCWQMSLFMLGSIPIMIGSQVAVMAIRLGATKMENDIIKKAGQIVSDSLQNCRTVQACGAEKGVLALYKGMVERAIHGCGRRNIIDGFGFGFSSGIMFFIIAASFYFASFLIKKGQTDFQGVMTAFLGIFYAAMGAGQAAGMMGDVTKAKVACHDMFKLLDRESKINGMEPTGVTPKMLTQDAGSIEFVDVKFHYPFRAEVQVLKGVSFRVTAGQRVGLVGPSGGGKSTVMCMLQRFYDPVQGEVLIGKERVALDSVNIRWWRKKIGFVGQEPVLFNTSVRENVLYGLDDGETVSAEHMEACWKMAALDFLNTEGNQGWDTQVGPRGGRLSGGQKQRVAICRALIKNPAIMMLDEATSALDTASEKIVQEALDRALEGRTSFAIAHRLSTIEGSDLIIVVAEGRVVESGTHTSLMDLKGVYYKLQKQAAK